MPYLRRFQMKEQQKLGALAADQSSYDQLRGFRGASTSWPTPHDGIVREVTEETMRASIVVLLDSDCIE